MVIMLYTTACFSCDVYKLFALASKHHNTNQHFFASNINKL